MKYWVGVTDSKWYEYLAARNMEEVNFWQPSGAPPFVDGALGMPFLFKLKRPYNHLAGGGYFVTYSKLPAMVAWEIFGDKNGCESMEAFRDLISSLKSRASESDDIGCTVLANCYYFSRNDWIENPVGWSSNIVRGKFYDTLGQDGMMLWGQTRHRIKSYQVPTLLSYRFTEKAYESADKYGESVMVRPRIGQSAFRVLVTDAYKRRCAITGENTLVALEAAHIIPYADEGDHDVRNGLLLRADFHRLYDVGLVGITPELRVRISPKIREAWYNGKSYYRLDNMPLFMVPEHHDLRPDPDRLSWHMKNRFQY